MTPLPPTPETTGASSDGIVNPTPQQERGVQSDQGDQPTFGSVLLNTVTGNEGREPVNPDADDGTTDNSQA